MLHIVGVSTPGLLFEGLVKSKAVPCNLSARTMGSLQIGQGHSRKHVYGETVPSA